MRASFIESFNLCSLLLSCFPSPHTRSSSSSSSSNVLPMYYSRVVYSFTLPWVCVCVCVLYITARALERVKMRLKIIQTDDEIVRLVNVYFETVWDTPVPFIKSRGFFVFSFFCFFLFPFERYGIALQSTVEHNTERERERERNKKINYQTTFFSLLFVLRRQTNIFLRGINSSLLLLN